MPVQHLYLDGFPEQHKVEEVDVVTLYHEERFDELDKVVVCKDESGKVTASFGDSAWYCFAFSRNKKEYKNTLNFNEFNNKDLQRELKLFTYGWIFNKCPKKRKALKFTSTYSRFKYAIIAYRHLAEKGFDSIRALSKSSNWINFEGYLVEKKYSQASIRASIVSINSVIRDSAWHKVKHEFPGPLKPDVLARRLNQLEAQQTLTIPERLCDAIYGKAIELIEGAHPYRHLIAQTESDLQDNYLKGKRILDENVANGATYAFMLANGEIDNQKYFMAIVKNQPQNPSDIIARLAKKLPDIPLNNGHDFKRYLGQLITASYIVCGGFSGMRDSELDKITPNSYYKDTFEGREYHMLQSHTFKLGEKRETWVTASSSKTAIELMTTLTEQRRQEVTYPDEKYTNSLWINHLSRIKPPRLISSWNERLQLLCKQFNFIVTEEDYQECLDSNPQSHERVKKYVVVGKPWHMTTHQFRRSLAFYCIKNRFGTMVALKQQFKHLYLAMTEWYTNGGRLASYRNLVVDEKFQSILDDINAETIADKIFKQWHSNEKLSGSHGKAIMKMRGGVPTIYSSWDVIYQAVKEGKLTLHGSLHSYCKSGYDCDMDGVVAPQFCVDCSSSSSIIDEQQAKWWQLKHRSLTAYMNEKSDDISVSERSHYITQVRAAENVMRDFDMDFVPFEAELNIVEV
ncbi:hypothetical protein [Vibrio sagamiensis]|uniref:Integrase n=1 Tax=Vibrio sagamiensis NBRC 104589 TaxID=1219064 RepID=A0A511QIU1_9VIBR|nr:hypothetical protein [Vibrio sagamiensis]PNQ64003.1 hypothetical protein C1141_10135 [Vibrio agarivorans]GEM77211.1 hypothetical protein VSA01S_33230 [Vibrio sagamiensis NBRC 104589]